LRSAVWPIGAQGSTRDVTLLGTNFTWAKAGDEIRRTTNINFFIGFLMQDFLQDKTSCKKCTDESSAIR